MLSRVEKYRELRESLEKDNQKIQNAFNEYDKTFIPKENICNFVKEEKVGDSWFMTFEIAEEYDEKLKEYYGTECYEEMLSKDFEEYLLDVIKAQRILDDYRENINALVDSIKGEENEK